MELERVSNPEKSAARPPKQPNKTGQVLLWLFLVLTSAEDLLQKVERIVPQIKNVIKQIFGT